MRAGVCAAFAGAVSLGGLAVSPSNAAATQITAEAKAAAGAHTMDEHGASAGREQRVVAGGMASISRSWPSKEGGYDDFETSITITKSPGYNGRTYWAHQWDYSGGGEGGYVGLQSLNGDDHAINFSIWGASGWSDAGSKTNCAFFGHEGSGVQCQASYAWREGVTYRIKIARSGTNGWQASVRDTRTGISTTVATIVLPEDRGGLQGLSEWVENFAQGSDQPTSCTQVPPATAVYGQPTANGGTVRTSSSSAYTYGDCASIAKSVCTTDQVCTLTVNQGALPKRRKLLNLHSGYCLDLLGGGANAGLWHCTSNPNQILTQDVNYRLTIADKAGLCLMAATGDSVKSATCNNSATQQWMYMPQSHAYFNAGTGKCLDPLRNAALSAPLRVYNCLGNGFQQWQAIP